MKCARCGGKTRVTQSYPGDKLDNPHGRYLLNKALRVFGWYAPEDFRVRERVCKGCATRLSTIEVELSDFGDAMATAATEPAAAGFTFGAVVAHAKQAAAK